MNPMLLLVAFSLMVCLASCQIPEGYVQTPRGYRHRSCVHGVESGATVIKGKKGELLVKNPDGSAFIIPPCSYPALNKKSPKGTTDQVGDSGWIEYGSFNGQNFNSFNGYWPVPSAPSSSDQQIVYIFPALMNQAEDEIIQPVLQWGATPAGGGNFWAVASWWVTSSDQALWSTLINATTGNNLYGTMLMGAQGSWTITGTVQGGKSTTLKVTNIDPQQVATVTLEVYGVGSCSDYPSSKSTTFTGLAITDGGNSVSPVWTPNVENTDCGENVNPVSSSVVILTY